MKLIRAEINPYKSHSRNVMPSAINEFVGSFIYFDHLGPFDFVAGREVYIPPHPHAGIATISYMFNGEGNHRDSLGNEQILDVGRLNYMNAGNGIMHSEGLSKNFSITGGKLLGIQIWHLLSSNERTNKPLFQTYSKTELGKIKLTDALSIVVLMGQYQNVISPVKTERETLFIAIETNEESNANIILTKNWQYLLYNCDGNITIAEKKLQTGEGFFIENESIISIQASASTKAILMGGLVLSEQPVFSGSLVAGDSKEMQYYQQRYTKGAFGSLEYNP